MDRRPSPSAQSLALDGRSTQESGAGVWVHLFGPVRCMVDGVRLKITARKQRAVLAMLALEAGRSVSVERLTEGIWGDEPPDTARSALQVYVSAIREALKDAASVLRTTSAGYLLDIEPYRVDVLAFELAVETARQANAGQESWRGVLDRWIGEPLADLLDVPFAGPWSTRLHELRGAALDEQFDAELEAGRHAALVPELEALLVLQPYREKTWRQLVIALYRDGRQADALAAFRRARKTLDEELGIDPGPALAALEHAILSQDPVLELARSSAALGIRVPRRASELIGRARELSEVARLAGDRRLVTITGPGGVGKTSVAIEAALRVTSEFPDGVVFVDLASVRDPGILLPSVARAVDAGNGSNEPIDSIALRLAGRRALVVLDNLEQVPDAPDAVARLAERVEGLHLLTTTRSALRIRGEELVRLEPLGQGDALALLAARAGRVGVNAIDPALATEIVVRLDGLPLAIELAAAACRVVPPRAVLDRIVRRVSLPAAPRDLPARQQTLEDTLTWGVDLLPMRVRASLLGLAAFEAPFTIEAAETLVDDPGITESLVELVEASLLFADDEHFRMLEAVRAFARSLWAPDQDWATRHAEWVIATSIAALPRLHGPEEQDALSELTPMLPDLRTAVDRLVFLGRHEDAAQVLLATRLVWYLAGFMRELTTRLEITSQGQLKPLTAAESAVVRSAYAHIFGNADALERLRTANADLARLDAKSIVLVSGLCHLAALEAELGEAQGAFKHADEAVLVGRECGDVATHAMALDLAGYVARTFGDSDRAVAATREAAELARASGSPQLISSLAGYAAALGQASRDADAMAVAWEAVELARRSGSKLLVAEAAMTVAPVLGPAAPRTFAPILAEAMSTYVALGALSPLLDAGIVLVQMAMPAGPADAITLAAALERRAGRGTPELLAAIADGERRLGLADAARLRGHGASLNDDELARLVVKIANYLTL